MLLEELDSMQLFKVLLLPATLIKKSTFRFLATLLQSAGPTTNAKTAQSWRLGFLLKNHVIYISDFPCDPRNPPHTVLVMVDVSKPMDPRTSENQKLSAVSVERSYF